MGAKGPGASTALRSKGALQAEKPARQPWDRRGLSRAGRVIAFLQSLPVTKGLGVGKPMKLLPFQLEWIEAVYAEGADGKRLVRTGLMSVARGNGKTVLVAGLCLAHLVGPEAEPRGECYSAAATKEQASLIFAEIEAWVVAVPWLAARLNVKRFHKTIEDLETGSTYRALASDSAASHGLAASFIACDELAQWKRRELFDVLRTSMGKREEPLLIAIGTQSPHPENLMSELVDYAGRVNGGELVDPSFHGALYSVPEHLDAFDPDNWHLANPALGLFRSRSELLQEAERAKRIPSFAPAFLNLYCNRRIDAVPHAIDPDEWAACGGPLDVAALAGRPCFAGLDLGSTRDLTALALYFPDDGGAVLAWHWCPKDGLAEKEELDRVPYRVWANDGLITPTPGKATDKAFVARQLGEIAGRYKVQGVAFDRWGFADLKVILDREGVQLPMVAFGQGFVDMAPAVNAFEAAMLVGKLKHGDSPILRWQASNAEYQTDPAGNRKLNKRDKRNRIDGIVAMVMAIGLAARSEVKEPVELRITWI